MTIRVQVLIAAMLFATCEARAQQGPAPVAVSVVQHAEVDATQSYVVGVPPFSVPRLMRVRVG